jgi:protease secretion system outer membrane protein
LATRTLNAVNQIVLATEAIKANEGQINALESQYKGAKRKFDLGQGTITDLLDVQVKFEQAKANDLMLRANLKGANDQFFAITGIYPTQNSFILPNKHENFTVEPLQAILDRVQKANPNIVSARATESIAKFDIAKAAGAVLPTVSYVFQRTNYNSVESFNNGLAISIPIDANSYADNYTAYAKSQASSSNRLQTETQTKVEAQKLHALVEAGLESLKIKWQAVDTARQSVTANQKSYEAGVKSTTDVLIAIQTLFQTRNEYAQAATNQASNYMNLLLVAAENPDEAVQKTQLFLFRK